MIYQEERAIAQAIKDKSLRCPALIYGSEEYLKQQVCSRLTKSANEAFSSFNDFRFDFEQLDLQGLSDVLSAPPMMADWRTVLVYNVDPKGFGAELYKQLEGLLGQVYEDCRVVFLEKSGCFDDKRDEKSKKVIKLFDKLGSVLHLKERTEGDLQKLIKSEAQQGGCTIVPAAAKQLLASCGRDIMTLKSEVQKLCAYKNWEGEITPEDVGLLTVQKAEDNIYGLSRAILRDDYDLAMKILGDLCYLRYPTESILGTLSQNFVDLYRARIATQEGKRSSEIAADFGYGKRTFAIDNALRDQRKLSDWYLDHALETLSRADIRLKSSQCDGRTVLEQTVTALFLKNPPKEAGR